MTKLAANPKANANLIVLCKIPRIKLRYVITESQSQSTKDKLSRSLNDLGGRTSELAARFLAKSITLAGVTHILTTYGDGLSSLTTHVLYGKFATTSNCCSFLLLVNARKGTGAPTHGSAKRHSIEL